MTKFQTMQFRVGCHLQLDILKPTAMSNKGQDAMAAEILRNCRAEIVDGAVKGFMAAEILRNCRAEVVDGAVKAFKLDSVLQG
ncbi:hypothetical protein RHMOL_Rhmol12G0115100 [Rhododendron molle]|uniref:Uncharacterized protein n=1 Tax=Rhododendron molle TaxID=49168 RepID=A0ACC0LGW8_RHOML|nr:hypothetical protein RHMOL_Rhmol12G0115100 [Rhododendron molle]